MTTGRLILLWAMMLLQYAVWGAWAVTAGKFMGDPPPTGLGFDGGKQGILFSLIPLATIVVTPIFSQLADRKVNAERLMGILHLVGAISLFGLSQMRALPGFSGCMLVFSICYAPTLSLSNAIVFANLTDSSKQFGGIRVAGTIGWIIAGWMLSFGQKNLPPIHGDMFILAAGFSLLLGILCFFLPAVPPAKAGTDPFAFRAAFKMLKDRNFLVFLICALVVGTELEFYYIHTGAFLGAPIDMNGVGIKGSDIAQTMSLGQIAEIVVMLLLPFFIKALGLRRTILLGIIAWPIRYAIFALAPNNEWARNLVVPSLTLHGFCYVFFFVAGFIYVDKIAPHEIRASAQGLIAFVVLGLGRFVGSLIAGWVQGYYTEPPLTPGAAQLVHWDKVFLVPTVLTVMAALVFPLLFKAANDKEVDLKTAVPSH